MVKQVLLSIPSVFAEMVRGESAQLSRGRFSFAGEILFAQDALDPDIDRKRSQPFVGE